MREDVRVKEEWLDPGGSERRLSREPSFENRRTEQRRLSGMLVAS